MKRLILTAVILSSLTACNKQPTEESTVAADVAHADLADLKPQDGSKPSRLAFGCSQGTKG
jgi:hypothetical protein